MKIKSKIEMDKRRGDRNTKFFHSIASHYRRVFYTEEMEVRRRVVQVTRS